jgi:hypothetical protein
VGGNDVSGCDAGLPAERVHAASAPNIPIAQATADPFGAPMATVDGRDDAGAIHVARRTSWPASAGAGGSVGVRDGGSVRGGGSVSVGGRAQQPPHIQTPAAVHWHEKEQLPGRL